MPGPIGKITTVNLLGNVERSDMAGGRYWEDRTVVRFDIPAHTRATIHPEGVYCQGPDGGTFYPWWRICSLEMAGVRPRREA